MIRVLGPLLAATLLLGCQPQPQEKRVAAPPASVAPTVPVAPPSATPPAPVAPPFTPARLYYESFRASADTVLRASGQPYYLAVQVRLDTLQPLTHITRRDTARGYQGYYTFTIRDSLRRMASRRILRKQDFYAAIGPELVLASNANLPTLLGYSAPLGALVFNINFGAPETDWGGGAVLLLTLQGQIQRVVPGYSIGGPDVDTALAPDGCTLLTAESIFRSRGNPLPLERPSMELRGAFLLGDSLAVVVYEPGTWRPTSLGSNPEWTVSLIQKRRPNTLVVNTRTGQVVSSFRYDGFWEELGFTVPYAYLPATTTGYLLDDKKGLYILPARSKDVIFRPFRSLAQFVPPARSSEKQVELAGYFRHYHFYIDTLDASRIRCQYEQVGSE